jgi:hypothetical protein
VNQLVAHAKSSLKVDLSAPSARVRQRLAQAAEKTKQTLSTIADTFADVPSIRWAA